MRRNKYKLEALGTEHLGKKVYPIDKVYYDSYQFKICFEGNSVKYDILMFSELDNLVSNLTWNYRTQLSSKNINLYLNEKRVFDTVIGYFKHTDYIEKIYGAIDQDHIDSLNDSSTEYVYRNKYWYDKYPIKITFSRAYDSSFNTNVGKEIRDFIFGTFNECRLYDTYTNNWYSNYLWLTKEEFTQGYPFLKLSYGNFIYKIQKIKLMEK